MTPSAASDHAQALADLEAGRPLEALKSWRQLLLAEPAATEACLQAAINTLESDAVAPLRRQAIALARSLLSQQPGESEVAQLGALLHGWGTMVLPEVPSRALQLLERAWSCGSDSSLNQRLASLHARMGYGEGAHWLAAPAEQLEPWPLVPCPTQACLPCQSQPSPADPPLQIHRLPRGRIALQRQRNPWRLSHGVGVWTHQGLLRSDLSRHYPWPWPHCPHSKVYEQGAAAQLQAAAADLPAPVHVEGPVLAIAELSGEMFFHWQLELLPRLGRVWQAAINQWPNLRLWHNGGHQAHVQQGLERLGITQDQLLPASDHLEATELLVPSFASAFGRPAAANLSWLEQFWGLGPAGASSPAHGADSVWLTRPGAVRRAVPGEQHHAEAIGAQPLSSGPVLAQLQQLASASQVIAPHGAAMANLLAANAGTRVLELVNPAYQPSYFDDLIRRRHLQHQRLEAAPTPLPLQEWLFEGPLAFPIDLRPGASPAGEVLASLSP